MENLDILSWCEPLMRAPFVWREVGSAGSIRAITQLRDANDRPVEYLNLVTAIAAVRGKVFNSGDYNSAATFMHMPDAVASALIRAGDNNLPKEHEYYVALTGLVDYLTSGGNL